MEITIQRITNSKDFVCTKCSTEKKNGIRIMLNIRVKKQMQDFLELGFICTDCFKEEGGLYTVEM